MLKKVIFLICAINIAHLSNAQDAPYLPPVVLPSPNAASLGTYGDHPVGTYTGIPDISIPIFGVDEKGNSLPISLSYHAGGVRADDPGSSVGMNWTLQAGGAITRSVRGLNDFSTRATGGIGYLSTDDSQQVPRFDFTNNPLFFSHEDPINTTPLTTTQALLIMEEQIKFGLYDTQPDNFFFNFNGFSGQFTYDRHRQIHLIKKSGSENFEIEEIPGNDGHPDPNFKITVGNGDVYYFEAREVTRSEASRFQPVSDPRVMTVTQAITSWYLTKVDFYSGGEINFEYSTPHASTTLVQRHTSEFYGKNILGCDGRNNHESYDFSNSHSIINQIFLQEITYSKGQIDFIYTGRQLDKVEIRDHNDGLVSSFLLSYDNSNRRWLTAVTEQGRNGVSKPPHSFSYYNKELLPSSDLAQLKIDHWGYYNDAGGLAPRNFKEYPYQTSDNYHANEISKLNYNETFLGAARNNREPDEEKMKYGILSKVSYPTGGHTTFEYEANQYSNFDPYWEIDSIQFNTYSLGQVCAYTNHNGGAYDCSNGSPSQLADWSSANVLEVDLDIGPFTSTYDHVKLTVERGQNPSDLETIAVLTRQNSGLNLIPVEPGFIRITAEALPSGPVSGYVNATVNSRVYPKNYVVSKTGPGLRIARITTHDGVDVANDIVRTYDYSAAEQPDKSSGIIMSKPQYAYIDDRFQMNNYASATDINGTDHLRRCRALMISSSSLIPLSASAGGGYVGYSFVTESFAEAGQLGRKTYTYINQEDELINESGDPKYQPKILGSVRRTIHSVAWEPPITSPVIPGLPRENYTHKNGSLINSKTYEYDDLTASFVLKQEEQSTYDFSRSGVAEAYIFSGSWQGEFYAGELMKWARYKVKNYTKRLSNQKVISYENNQSNTTSTQYFYTTSDGTKLDRIEVSWEDGTRQNTRFTYPTSFSTRVTGASVDKGNNNSYVKLGGYYAVYADGKLSKIYEYERQGFDDYNYMPDGEPANSEFFKVSAEYAYNNNDRLIQETRRDGINKSYLWGYGGEYPIAEVVGAETTNIFYTSFEDNGIADSQSKTGDKVKTGSFQFPTTFSPSTSDLLMSYWYWQNGKWQFSGEIPYHSSIGPFTKLDEVRVYPRGALMTTYTYKPMVGLTSLTDPNNLTSYFQYDDLNRLIMVKDNDGKILETTQYNYAK